MMSVFVVVLVLVTVTLWLVRSLEILY